MPFDRLFLSLSTTSEQPRGRSRIDNSILSDALSLSNGWAVARVEGCGLWEWQGDHESPRPELLSEDDGSDGLMTGFSREIIPQTVVCVGVLGQTLAGGWASDPT